MSPRGKAGNDGNGAPLRSRNEERELTPRFTRTPPCGWPLVVAVVVAVGFSAFMLVSALASRDRMPVPGAAMSVAAYGTLGYFAIRGRQWARWVFFTLIFLTTLTCALFTFINMGGVKPRLDFTPGLAIISLLYAAIAVAIAIPAPRRC